MMTIDGGNKTSGSGVVFEHTSGIASIANLLIQNTGDHGVRVSGGGTVEVKAGVRVSGAGRTSAAQLRRSGLMVVNGVANINVPAGGATTSFRDNTEHGVAVGGLGIVNITGVPVTSPQPNGEGTVVAAGNEFANIYIAQTPGAAAGVCNLDGVVSWGGLARGLRVFGGSRVKVRNSVILGNAGQGVYVTAANNGATGNDITAIDLGTSAEPGKNYLQGRVGANPNGGGGVCVQLAANNGNLTLNAAGNLFAGPDSTTPYRDCSVDGAGAVTRNATCRNGVDVGVVPALGTNVTVDVTKCSLTP
jgi:hypothetical protein